MIFVLDRIVASAFLPASPMARSRFLSLACSRAWHRHDDENGCARDKVDWACIADQRRLLEKLMLKHFLLFGGMGAFYSRGFGQGAVLRVV